MLSRHADHTLGLIFTTNALAEACTMRGALREAVMLFEEGLAVAGEQLQYYTLGGHLELGDVYRERNELAAAEEHLRASLELAGRTGRELLVPKGYVALARTLRAGGDEQDADAALATVHMLATRSGNHALRRYVEAHQARVSLRRGTLGAALRWAAQRDPAREPGLAFVEEADQLTAARVLIAQGATDDARRLLADLAGAATAGGHDGILVEILALEALASQAAGEAPVAQEALARALLLGGPEGYVRVFADEGLPMVELLQQVNPDSRAAAFAQYILGAYSAGQPAAPAVAPTTAVGMERAVREVSADAPGPVEALSTREVEVLRLLAAGASNSRIAELLTLSPFTVKRHVSNIFSKLGVRSRTEAAARARALDLD